MRRGLLAAALGFTACRSADALERTTVDAAVGPASASASASAVGVEADVHLAPKPALSAAPGPDVEYSIVWGTQILDHLGNLAPAPGNDLDLDLMHGTPTRYQRRYYPSDVDAGILADLGLPVAGTPAADAVCKASKARLKASGSAKLGPVPKWVE